MNALFVVVMLFSALVIIGWALIPIAVVMLDSEEAESWNGKDNQPIQK